ncbi:MAG: hypothetical protein HRT45_01390 [Bdellovibrionales bacterium]|nr:hypothetical protein [Bdellovibrionales bacterium]
MKPTTMSKKQGLYFAACNVLAGVGNYLFQLDASRGLTLIEFGDFTSWLAKVSTLMSLAMFFNYFSNFIDLGSKKVIGLCLIALGLGGLSFSVAVLSELSMPLLFAGFVAIMLRLVFSWVDGQIQRRLLFYALGTSLVLKASSKLVIPRFDSLFSSSLDLYAWAFTVCLLPAAFFSILVVIFQFKKSDETKVTDKKSSEPLWRLAVAAMLLSFCSVITPQLDILVVNWTQDPETLGQFSRVSLIFKALFFGLSIGASWLLPFQIRAAREGQGTFSFFTGLRFRSLFLLSGFALAGVASVTAPPVLEWMLGFDLTQYRVWIFLSCVTIMGRLGMFVLVQQYCAGVHIRPVAIASLVLLAELVIFSLVRIEVTTYLAIMSVINIGLFYLLPHLEGRRPQVPESVVGDS